MSFPAPTREAHLRFCTTEGWELVRSARGAGSTHHDTFELALPTGGTPSTPEPCGDEGQPCCPRPPSMVYRPPCRDDQLQCCADVCRLSCTAPEEPLDGWSEAPECDLAPHQACAQDAGCVLVEHRLNCCGTVRIVAVADTEVAVTRELAETCAPTTTCECEAALVTEGQSIPKDAEVSAVCRDGWCGTRALIL